MPEMNREEIAKLEALYASNPEGRVFTHLAEAYRKAGDFDRARRILEQGLKKHPGYASAYVVLGRVQLDLGQNQEAGASFRRVLELDPHNLVALRSLGDLARAAGDRNQALAYFEELRHQDPGNDEVESLIAALRKAPAPPEPAPEPEPEPQSEREPEAASAAAAERSPDFGEEQGSPEPEAEPEPFAPGPEAAAPEPAQEASPASLEVETGPPGADVLFVEEQEQELEIMEAFEDSAGPERDYGDLVTPDIELNWEGGEPSVREESPLPGDLADFAELNASFDIREDSAEAEPEPPPPEEMPEIHFPDVGEPADIDAELAEAEADEEAAATAGVVTETMAQLYRDQGLYERAAEVYRQLLADRPYDADLARNLAEVEALASIIGSDQTAPEEPAVETTSEPVEQWETLQTTQRPQTPEGQGMPERPHTPEQPEMPGQSEQPGALEQPFEVEEPFAFSDEPAPALESIAPEAAEPPATGYFADYGFEQEEEVPSPWTTPQGAVPETPNPYTWTEEQQPDEDLGQPVQAYFRELLAWRPSRTTGAPAGKEARIFAAPTSFESQADASTEPEPEVANFASPPELEDQPAILELTTPAEPPAIPADELMPWEEPASPSMPSAAVSPSTPLTAPTAPQAQPPRSSGPEDPVEAAFDEWFNAVDPTPSAQSPAPPADAAGPPPAASAENVDGDDDDDLEMFRSWLQSLKK